MTNNDQLYQPLFDLVESGKTVVFTGAGFSRDFLRDGKKGTQERLPDWFDLLKAIRAEFSASGSADFKTLSGAPADQLLDLFFNDPLKRGEHMIEIASILRRHDVQKFDEFLKEFLTPSPNQPLDVLNAYKTKHDAVVDLEPLGIVTMNVDKLHEEYCPGWKTVDAVNDSEELLLSVMKDMQESKFLVKGHGTLGKRIVFDYSAYRELIEKNPAYSALMGYIFSHCRVIFLGFGLSDLDFDLLIDNQVRRFGSPLQQHVAIQVMPTSSNNERDQVIRDYSLARFARLAERYGIQLIPVQASEIVPLLQKTLTTPGRRLLDLVAKCSDPAIDTRKIAHREMSSLGLIGKRIAIGVLKAEFDKILQRHGAGQIMRDDILKASELIYSMGILNPKSTTDRATIADILIKVAETSDEVEVVAHALWALTSLVSAREHSSLTRLKASGRLSGLKNDKSTQANPGRCEKYLDAMIARAEAEAAST